MLDIAVKTVMFFLAVYLLLLGFVYINQSNLLYLPGIPSREVIATPADIGLPYEAVSLTTNDGIRLDGWYIPAQPGRGELLFFHGNAGNIGHRLQSIRVFHQLGLGVFIFDYRGYGRSEGSPSEEGTYRDAESAWRYLVERREIPRERIVVFGRSLGGALAAKVAAEHDPGALILESTFTSVPDLGADLYGFFPVRSLSRFRYSTADYLADVDCPVLVIHSSQDDIIPFAHGKRLFRIAEEPKAFLKMRGGHNEAFLVTGEVYVEGIDAFLSRHL